mgnify:CR=1 FL=1
MTSVSTSPELQGKLREALRAAVNDPALASVREALLLRDIAFLPAESYGELADFEQAALSVGYRELPAPMRSPLRGRDDSR